MADVLGIPLGGCVQNVRHEFIHEAIGFYHRPSVPIGLWSPYCWSPSPLSPKKYQIHWVVSLKPQTNSTRYNLDLTFGMAMERNWTYFNFALQCWIMWLLACGVWNILFSDKAIHVFIAFYWSWIVNLANNIWQFLGVALESPFWTNLLLILCACWSMLEPTLRLS